MYYQLPNIYKSLSYLSKSLMTDVIIYYLSTFSINLLIICHNSQTLQLIDIFQKRLLTQIPISFARSKTSLSWFTLPELLTAFLLYCIA